MTGVSLTRMGSEGFAVIAALYEKAFDDPWPAPSVRELLSSFGTWSTIALIDDTPVGFLLARVVVDEAEVLSIGVDPAHRRAGVARALLTHDLPDMQRKGAKSCFLEVGCDNPGAVQLYLSLGFLETGRRKNYYRRADGTRIDALLMQKRLTARPK